MLLGWLCCLLGKASFNVLVTMFLSGRAIKNTSSSGLKAQGFFFIIIMLLTALFHFQVPENLACNEARE